MSIEILIFFFVTVSMDKNVSFQNCDRMNCVY